MKKAIKRSEVKRKILQELRKGGIVSGDDLASNLGISRVAVWKHIKELRALGYEIVSTPKGYGLLKSPNKPYPWELEFESYYFTEVSSTMDVAKELARKGLDKVFVIAETQKKGRGRLGRGWESQRGGLYFSFVLKPNLSLKEVDKILVPVSKAIFETLREYALSPDITPNYDVFVNGKKIAGILVEAEGEIDRVEYVIIGVGVNVNNSPPEGATSMRNELGREVNLLEFTKKLFERIYHNLSDNFLSSPSNP